MFSNELIFSRIFWMLLSVFLVAAFFGAKMNERRTSPIGGLYKGPIVIEECLPTRPACTYKAVLPLR